MSKAADIQSMFARISGRYDLFNRVFSGGTDLWWRHRLVRSVLDRQPGLVLDLATGSGDVALALQNRGLRVIGADFCPPMLELAARKGVRELVAADALQLPFPDATFDAVTIAFGFRNLVDRDLGLREMLRVVKPGGSLHILEFSHPHRLIRNLYFWYLETIMPRIVSWATGQGRAYDYLCESIRLFPDQKTLETMISAAGWDRVGHEDLTFGIVALHTGTKPTA
jgi:demethylmenaquinone methyltransferase/2-methoxy-6-polyprenyl-1,4-benzoquinol methylase